MAEPLEAGTRPDDDTMHEGRKNAVATHRPFTVPSRSRVDSGELRRVGFELEFSGLTLEQAAVAVADSLGASHHRDTSAEHSVVASELGEFAVEVDWRFLKEQARRAADSDDDQATDWTASLSELATLVVPIEVVCPPIAMDGLDALNPVVDALRRAGAVGTGDSLLAAYGVHINPEIPRLDAATLHRYLRAFALLQWWLMRAHDVDTTRRLSPYIDPWPEAYLLEVLAPGSPDLDDLLDQYLAHNATRNRALDMLPLFCEVDADKVEAATQDPRIKARPTFHYRLPDCRIEQPDWSLAVPWERWCVVEALADDDAAIDLLAERFRAARRPLLGVAREAWVEEMDTWLRDRALV